MERNQLFQTLFASQQKDSSSQPQSGSQSANLSSPQESLMLPEVHSQLCAEAKKFIPRPGAPEPVFCNQGAAPCSRVEVGLPEEEKEDEDDDAYVMNDEEEAAFLEWEIEKAQQIESNEPWDTNDTGDDGGMDDEMEAAYEEFLKELNAMPSYTQCQAKSMQHQMPRALIHKFNSLSYQPGANKVVDSFNNLSVRDSYRMFEVSTESSGNSFLDWFSHSLKMLNPGNIEEYIRRICWMILKTTDSAEINDVVERLFEQSLQEPKFQYTGARICQYLNRNFKRKPYFSEFLEIFIKRSMAFMVVLVGQCDNASDKNDSAKFFCITCRCQKECNLRNELKNGSPPDQERLRRLSMLMAEIFVNVEIQRENGSIQKLQFLPTILIDLVSTLLTMPSDLNVKYSCWLLKLSGSLIEDIVKHSVEDCIKFEKIFTQLMTLRDSSQLTKTVKFLIGSVHKLKEADWNKSSSSPHKKSMYPLSHILKVPEPVFYNQRGIPCSRVEAGLSEEEEDDEDDAYFLNNDAYVMNDEEEAAFLKWESKKAKQMESHEPWGTSDTGYEFYQLDDGGMDDEMEAAYEEFLKELNAMPSYTQRQAKSMQHQMPRALIHKFNNLIMEDKRSCSSSRCKLSADPASTDKKGHHSHRLRGSSSDRRSQSQSCLKPSADVLPNKKDTRETDRYKRERLRGSSSDRRSQSQSCLKPSADVLPNKKDTRETDRYKRESLRYSRGMQRSPSETQPRPLMDFASVRRNAQEADQLQRDRNYISSSSHDRGYRGFGGHNGSRRGQSTRGHFSGSRDDMAESKARQFNSKTLNTWASMEDAGHLVLLMSLKQEELKVFINQSTDRENWLEPLVKAISHALTAQHQKESLKQLLNSLCSSQFFQHLALYFTEQQLNEDSWDTAEQFVTSCIEIFDEILNKLPEFASLCFTATTSLTNAAPNIKCLQENKHILCDITEFSKKASEVFMAEKEKEKRTHSKICKFDNSEQPPDNFLDLPIVPTESDLQEDAKPFIRCAQIEGTYENIHHYLDINFRLLREDFIFPLRQGIREFKNSGCRKNFKSSDLRFYFDVKIIGTLVTETIDHIVQFNISTHRNVIWENSKRFMFGSLLCLSKDNFKTVNFATVAQHDDKNLAKGIIVVTFKTRLEDVFNATSNDVYVMAETTAYFESYCHVLEGLQEMITKLPLQDYIIHCKSELQPPQYLLPSGGVHGLPLYDLSCLMENEIACKVPVLTTVKWPKAEVMCLNESQRAAAQLALTKELAIIQGPPGTGKTYVGLKVMQVLLENKHIMAKIDENSSDPILVVCYTNHALDQFLEGVLKFCPDGIVRVGGQSKSKNLEQFNLIKLRKMSRKMSVISCQEQIESISTEISKLNQLMEHVQNEITNDRRLKEFMKSTHYDSLVSKETRKHSEKLMNLWLNASSDTTHSLLSAKIKQHLTMIVLKVKNAFPRMELTPKMNIIQRACFYHRYLKKYEIIARTELTRQQGNAAAVQQIRDCLKAAQTIILPDLEMKRVLFPRALELMCKDISTNCPQKDNIVESWLLGLHQNLASQLDDIETLTNFGRRNVRSATSETDHVFNKVQNDRKVDDDDTHTDKLNASLRAALNNISFVAQRAEMLGISDKSLEVNDPEETEYQTVSRTKRFSVKAVQKKMKLIEPMTEEKETSITDVWKLELNERFALYKLWVQRYKNTLVKKMQTLVNRYTSVQDIKQGARNEETLSLLRKAKVIGMTTSGAARHIAVLQAVGCRIIVVEEAAEVLESHIVTSLNKNCKHLILIGDHQQLRPNPTVYQLAKDFGLEISLFERLIKNKVPHVMLKEQHRMRPEISIIMRHIYPDLQDHPSVANYEKIRGVPKNIFFVQHEHKETHLEESKSKANTHEAKFLVALCQYLLNQDFKASQITILATYSGQVFEITKAMREQKLDPTVLVTAVDNYQGEENDIILLSLVRSNTENRAGFLKVDNRVCVALSRAKKGLYVIGNFTLLASESKLWSKIINTANEEQIIDTGLPVICENHPDFQEKMISDTDFKKCPEGGCGKPCHHRLQCGHTCEMLCHGYDSEHVKYKCRKECCRTCEAGHPCRKECYQDCGDCRVLVLKKIPLCGHEDKVPCHIPPEKALCTQKCPCILDCQHQCSGNCGQCVRKRKHDKCKVPKMYQWPCGHSDEVTCHRYPPAYPCNLICGATLQCGHKCKGKCLECLNGAVHVACNEKCNKKCPCGHACPGFCSTPCLPCTLACPGECRHGSCARASSATPCSHACLPCKERCLHRCKHVTCSKQCSEDCENKCNKRCYRPVPRCNHRCSGLCGELCVCGKCEKVSTISKKAKTIKDGCKSTKQLLTETDTDQNVTVTKDTVKQHKRTGKNIKLLLRIPTCNHIFYVDDLDGCGYLLCPECQSPILKCMRYENINKERSRRREQEKNKLQMMTRVSDKQRRDLLLSKRCLKDCSAMREFNLLDVEKMSNLVEFHAVAFQIKCAFVMNEVLIMSEILRDYNFTGLLTARNKVFLQIQDRLTNQQKDEFTNELLRCFWLSYLSYLKTIPVSSEESKELQTDATVTSVLEDLKKSKPDNNILDKASLIFHERIKQIDKCNGSSSRLCQMEKTSLDVTKILTSKDDEDACHCTSDITTGAQPPIFSTEATYPEFLC